MEKGSILKTKSATVKQPLISVIIPVYNGGNYLECCYSCLEGQTYKNLEFIFINDGSIDDTKELLSHISKLDKRVKIITKEVNEGVSKARNTGLDVARGSFISFYDVDDIIDSRYFEVMLKEMYSYNVDIVVCAASNIQGSSNVMGSGALETGAVTFTKKSQYYNLYNTFTSDRAACSLVWGRLIKKSVIGNQRFQEDIKYGEDALFMMTLYSKSPKTYMSSYLGYYYILHRGSACDQANNLEEVKAKQQADAAYIDSVIDKLFENQQ